MSTSYVAVDLGATSGRVLRGSLDSDAIRIDEVRRFTTPSLDLPDGLHWDIGGLHREILQGITAAVSVDDSAVSISCDTWGVDYALLSGSGTVLGLPFSHRDARTRGRTDGLDNEFLFAETGILTQEINTLVQLLTEPRNGALGVAESFLFMPDLVAYLLSGIVATDRTIASTSQLLSTTGEAANAVNARYELPHLLPQILPNASSLGGVRRNVTHTTGFRGEVVVGAGHDTACAVAAIPAEDPDFAFISCGTWGVVGFELATPCLTADARVSGFTNEHGVDGTYRFLRNVTGLWLLNESMRSWGLHVDGETAAKLVDSAQHLPRFASIIDPLDPTFLHPGDVPERIALFCTRTRQQVPSTPAEFTRCVIDSLALSFANTITEGARVAGVCPLRIHMVGGGSAIADLCATVATLTGLPVIAGPVEATGLGNILLQAKAHGEVTSLARAREIVRANARLARYEPNASREFTSRIEEFLNRVAPETCYDS